MIYPSEFVLCTDQKASKCGGVKGLTEDYELC